MEVAITVGILALASYFLYKNLRKKASGKCDCSCCSNSSCGSRNKDKKPVQ